jgi:putative PIN family toxin of toxin-antitoxin system
MQVMIPDRVVIDTNVCLDLFVFRDARWAPLLNALQDRRIHAVTRADCRTEWLLVLDYPHLPLDPQSRARAKQEFDQLIACIAPDADASTKLPVCKDRDDQKFLELAHHSGAQTLITKDKALLKLARKTAKTGLFAIVTPEAWVAAADQSAG